MSLMFPDLGAKPIADIKPADLLAALRKVEAKSHLETARRMFRKGSRPVGGGTILYMAPELINEFGRRV